MKQKILITAGPTREYLDPVRYLSNGSSGRMAAALAAAAIESGFLVEIVSGPVALEYPQGANVTGVVSTAEMLDAAMRIFPDCCGVIGVAAPCDFRPIIRATHKMTKNDLTRKEKTSPNEMANKTFSLELEETPDILASLGTIKTAHQWSVAFALETDDPYLRVQRKIVRKNADFCLLNRVGAIGAETTSVEMIAATGEVLARFDGEKPTVAQQILKTLARYVVKSG